MSDDVKNFQDAADLCGVKLSAEILLHTFTYQYQLFSDKRCRPDDYIYERVNEVLESMVNHYGKQAVEGTTENIVKL